MCTIVGLLLIFVSTGKKTKPTTANKIGNAIVLVFLALMFIGVIYFVFIEGRP